MEIKHLQDLINNKAEARLNSDLKKLLDTLESNRLLRGFDGYRPKLCIKYKEDDVVKYTAPETLDRLLNPHWGALRKEIYDNFLPVYIAEESQYFINRIGEIEQSVDDLLNNQTY